MTDARINNNNQTINTIITQLGGNRFFAMTGSKPLYKDVNTDNPLIALKLTRNAAKATHMTITYMSGMDLYKMEFSKCRKSEIEIVKTFDGIYGDQLQEIFTDVTGLYTSL